MTKRGRAEKPLTRINPLLRQAGAAGLPDAAWCPTGERLLVDCHGKPPSRSAAVGHAPVTEAARYLRESAVNLIFPDMRSAVLKDVA